MQARLLARQTCDGLVQWDDGHILKLTFLARVNFTPSLNLYRMMCSYDSFLMHVKLVANALSDRSSVLNRDYI